MRKETESQAKAAFVAAAKALQAEGGKAALAEALAEQVEGIAATFGVRGLMRDERPAIHLLMEDRELWVGPHWGLTGEELHLPHWRFFVK